MYPLQELTKKIIAAAIEVHKNLGPGLLEIVYFNCLCVEFELQGLAYQKELGVSFPYKNRPISCSFRLDFLVENEVVVELKSVEKVLEVHEAQLLTYLKLTGKRVASAHKTEVRVPADGASHLNLMGTEIVQAA